MALVTSSPTSNKWLLFSRACTTQKIKRTTPTVAVLAGGRRGGNFCERDQFGSQFLRRDPIPAMHAAAVSTITVKTFVAHDGGVGHDVANQPGSAAVVAGFLSPPRAIPR